MSGGLGLVVDLLRCPRCRGSVTIIDRQLVCTAGHAYDIARQGYVNLLAGGPPAHADTVAMVAARAAFLGAGHYDPIIDAIASAPPDRDDGPDRVIIDVGAGTGHHLARLLDRTPTGRGLAIDISVPASRRAARTHPQLAAVVADVWQELPLRDGVADLIMVVFAPRHFAEFARVLTAAGRVVVVTPESDHLHEIVQTLGLMSVEPGKADRLRRDADRWFEITHRTAVRFRLQLSPDAIGQAIAMGPNAFHLDPATITEQLPRVAEQAVTVACAITELRRRPA